MNLAPRPLHPVSMLFQTFAIGKHVFLPIAFVAWNMARNSWFGMMGAVGMLLVLLLLFGGFAFLHYWTYRYQLLGEELIVTSGLIFRSKRVVPVSRIQNVDLVQNVVHRILKVAEVRVETASGTEPEAVLKVLALKDVDSLRSQIEAARVSARSATDSPSTDPPQFTDSQATAMLDAAVTDSTPIAASTTLLQIPLKWLVQAGLASNRGFVMVGIVLGLISQQFGNNDQLARKLANELTTRNINPDELSGSWWSSWLLWVGALVIAVFAIRLLGIAWYVLRFHGYRLELRDENFHLSCGLLTKVSATVPRRRIQWISIQASPLERWMKLCSIRIETAGGAGQQNENAATTVTRRWFIPIVPQSEVPSLMKQLRPGLQFDEDTFHWRGLDDRALRRRRRKGLLRIQGVGLLVALFTFLVTDQSPSWLPISSTWGVLLFAAMCGLTVAICLAPFSLWLNSRRHRHFQFAELPTKDGIVIREGVWTRKTSCTFYDRIQSISCEETPFDRRWKMRTVRIDTAAAGPANHVYRLPMLSHDVADAQFRRLTQKTSQIEMVWD
ncbi:PH domain-containing protein [Rhodopirellula halodulae]|uniref:PH domain-containing protein n=1 Tax=Rhodopirellula halodulae TaxID=2894198 RepID=UPI001E527C9B|nr:PH domain-containing protein [Rhodopirellula sp. JC737]MCC9658464.1 PH domain-containing protein [Rhodopirellula sp. JC737]